MTPRHAILERTLPLALSVSPTFACSPAAPAQLSFIDRSAPWTPIATKTPGSPRQSSATPTTDGPAVNTTGIPANANTLFVRLAVSAP